MYLHPLFQKAYQSKKRYIVTWGGRAGSKTISTGIVLLAKALSERCKILCTRKFQVSIKDSVYSVLVELIEKYPQFQSRFEVLKTSIICKDTGSEFIFRGMQNISEVKSLQGVKYVWLEESNFLSEEDFEILSKTIRTRGSQIWVVFNPHLPEDYVYKRFITQSDPLAHTFKIGWQDNPFFKRQYVGSLVDERENDFNKSDIAKYNWIWEGECLTNTESAAFKSEWIKYVDAPQHFDKVVVAIDPSGSDNKTSDACGLVVAGKHNDTTYIVEDSTSIASPHQWATSAINLYYQYKANYIVYEENYGGQIVRDLIRQIDKNVAIKGVRANKGKLLRAEPVAGLYEQGRVYHIRRFPELEYEMTTYTGEKRQKSPNRMDAMVYSVLALNDTKVIQPNLVGVRL